MQQNKAGPKKFNFGFPTKKKPEEVKRKATTSLSEEPVKKPRSNPLIDDEDDLLAFAGISKFHILS